MDQRLSATHENLETWHQENQIRFQKCQVRIDEIMRFIENDKKTFAFEQEKHLAEVKKLEKLMQERFEQEKICRQEKEDQLIKLVEEKYIGLKQMLSQESHNRYDGFESVKNNMSTSMHSFQA